MEKVELGQSKQENNFKIFRQEEINLQSQLRDIREKMEEMENNKRNNLIFYGLQNDPYESHASLHQKVSERREKGSWVWYQIILDPRYLEAKTADCDQYPASQGKQT